jgi:hypothetical protein
LGWVSPNARTQEELYTENPHRKFDSECSSQASKQLHAERTEEETIDSTIKSILQLPSFKDIAERELTNINSEKRLRNYISYVVHEETISMEYMMRHPPQNGESLPQKMLYIGMTKPHNDSKPDEDWTIAQPDCLPTDIGTTPIITSSSPSTSKSNLIISSL